MTNIVSLTLTWLQDHRVSQSSIAKLVMSTQIIVQTVHSPSNTPCVSPTPSRPPTPPSTILQLDSKDQLSLSAGHTEDNSGTRQDSSQSLDNTFTDTTGLDTTTDRNSRSDSLKHIPDIVEELISRKQSRNAIFGKHISDQSYISREIVVTSDDELLSDSRKYYDSDDDTKDLFKPRAASDPVSKNQKKRSIWQISHSERKNVVKNRRRSNPPRRQKSIELLDKLGLRTNIEPNSNMRRSGVKSDGDDLSAGEEARSTRRGSDGLELPDGRRHKAMNAVRSRGRGLVDEMKNVSSGMKNWTRRNIPTLNR